MTLFAVELQVHSFEREVFVELAGRFPAVFVVTLLTIAAVRTVVNISVTAGAVLGLVLGEQVVTLAILRLGLIPCGGRFVTLLA